MADNKIEVEYITTVAGALQAIEKLNKRLDQQENKLQRIGDASKKSADMAVGSFNRLEAELKEADKALRGMAIGSKQFDDQKKKVDQLRAAVARAKQEMAAVAEKESPWPAIGKGMTMATGAAAALFAGLVKVAQAQRAIISNGADQGLSIDTLARRMQIQAGLSDEQRQAQTAEIIRQSSAAGLTAETGIQAATQLAGSGFADAVQTGTLKTVLDTMQASSFQGAPDQLVSAFAEALNAYGLEKTNQNLQQIAVASQSLFKQTDFQLTELADFAKNASVFEGANIKIDEALAAFTALREVLPAAESGTGLRNFVNKLQAGDLTKENKDNLERIGVKADQVDFVGENLTQVLTTIRDATAALPEAQRNAALGKMFGTENVASARLLMGSVGRIGELQASQGDGAQFARDRDIAAGGMQADRNRIENERLLNVMPFAGKLNEMEIEQRKREAKDEATVQRITAETGAGVGLVAQSGLAVARTVDAVVGRQGVTQAGGGSGALSSSIPGAAGLMMAFIQQSARKQDEQIRLQQEANELLRQQQAKPMAVKVQNAAVRPKEVPLPAVTTP